MLIQQDFGTIYGGGELIVGVEKEVGTFTDEHGVTHKRYVKIVDCGAMPNTGDVKQVSHGITNLMGFINMHGVIFDTQGNAAPLPYTIYLNSSIQVLGFWVGGDDIKITSNFNYTSFNGYVTLEYYK